MRRKPAIKSLTPNQLREQLATDLGRAAALRIRLDDLADAMSESSFPPVDFDDRAWFVDGDRWAAGLPLDPDANND